MDPRDASASKKADSIIFANHVTGVFCPVIFYSKLLIEIQEMEDIGLLLILHGIYRESFLYQWTDMEFVATVTTMSAYAMVVMMIII